MYLTVMPQPHGSDIDLMLKEYTYAYYDIKWNV